MTSSSFLLHEIEKELEDEVDEEDTMFIKCIKSAAPSPLQGEGEGG